MRDHAGVFDVSHMGEIETTGPDAEAFLQRILSNDVTKIAENGAQYSVLCKEDGGVLDDLFTYRLGDDRYLTVTNASNHEKDLAWFQPAGRGLRRRRSTTRLHDYAMLAVQGPQAREIVAGLTDGELPKRFRTATLTVAGVAGRARLRHRLHRRGRRRAADRARRAPPRSGTRWSRRASSPAGLGARDTLRLEVCFHLYGNDLMETRGPIEAGLGWCVKEDTGFIGAEAIKVARERRPVRDARPVRDRPAAASPARATPVHGGGEVTSGTLSPVPRRRASAWPTCRSTRPSRAPQLEIDVRGRTRTAEVRDKPLY